MSQALEETLQILEPAPVLEPPGDLPYEDGEPLESNWHRLQIALLVELVHRRWF